MVNIGTQSLALFGVVALVISLAMAATATAEPTGDYAEFAKCPYSDPAASKCLYSATEGGEVVLGSRRVPIVEPFVLQGAYKQANAEGLADFIAANEGATLSEAPQVVPGGLMGIVAPEGSSPLVNVVVALLFDNALLGVKATPELAGPVSGIKVSENNLGGEEGTALRLPVKVHLENSLLGASCYIGSARAPLIWNLTSGAATVRGGKPLAGTAGRIEFLNEGRIIETKGTTLVDASWATPQATGCGGPLSFWVNPLVNKALGLPAPPGKGKTTVIGSLRLASVQTVAKESGESSDGAP